MWIRSDWLEALRLETPETMRDVLEIARAFATQDPDGNGKNDTYGLGVNKGLIAENNLPYAVLDGFSTVTTHIPASGSRMRMENWPTEAFSLR